MKRVLGVEAVEALGVVARPEAWGDPTLPSVVTIGKFFAVHRGHQALLQATVASARAIGAQAVALTFDRHPIEVLRPGTELPELTSLTERLDLMEREGLDRVVVLRVTPELLEIEAEQFVREVLVGRLRAREVLAGEQFRFGRGALGTVELLRSLGAELGFTCPRFPPVLHNGERISGSRVGTAIAAGAVAEAAILLGRPYAVPGAVIQGAQVGRTLGFPTANLDTPPRRLLPADGVYVARLAWEGEAVPAVVNLGVRPTVDGRRRVLEAHLLGWSGDLYGREVRLEFLDRLRDEQRFPDLEALKAQIAQDVVAAQEYFAAHATPT
jgi:riboflavin kinase/FMN adenylyltransferase